ncbi:MAG TPA: hypothetical protein VGE66_09100 [Chitinophagaceae bacterium]
MTTSELKLWLPYKLLCLQDEILCRWLYIGEKRFVEPFFDETILKCLSHPYNSKRFKSVSSIDLLPQWAWALDHLRPTAFIFHISRCGSTLLSQLLSLAQQNIVISEGPFLDELLRLPFQSRNISEIYSDQLFTAALSFYGQKRMAAERHLFLKTDSWHILFYDRLRRLFPNTLFILLYRKPDEVLYSHQRRRGIHAVPNIIEADLFGFDKDTLNKPDLDWYLAKVLEKYYAAYLEVIKHDSDFILANYSEGMLNIFKRIETKTGIGYSKKEWQRAKERAGFDAKSPDTLFGKQQKASEYPEYMQTCFALYQQIETFRRENE